MIFNVYVSGRVTGLSYEEVIQYREQVYTQLKQRNIGVIDPLRGCENLKGKVFNDFNVPYMNEVVLRDLSDVSRCDAVLVLTGDYLSWGTALEFSYATFVVKKPTVVIATNGLREGWLNHFATRVVGDLDEAILVLEHWKQYWKG